MAVVSENINERIIRHYSDKGLKLRQIETNEVYEEAYDLIPCRYTYEETSEKIIE